MKILLLLLVSALAAQGAEKPAAPARPNILLIVADDMGFSDVGCYGGEIATPNLDALAANGLRFTQFYNTARCWPTRSCLMTGYYAQQVRADPPNRKLPLPSWALTVPQRLKPLGYRCYHTGKWHVMNVRKVVADAGFDHSYLLNDHDRNFNPQDQFEDDVRLPPVKPGSGYYTTTAYADHAIQCLKEHAEKYAGQPFFSYLAFTVPHFPLQAPAEDIARYTERYKAGWDAIRDERLRREKELGLVNCELSPLERNVGPPYDNPEDLKKLGPGECKKPRPWQELTPEQREFQAAKMAIHAAMVDRMDREIGRVIDQVKAMGAFDNTLILFLSDNGASAEIMIRGDGHDRKAAPGSAGSFLCLGPGWSSAANTPFRRHKVWTHEGGISTPLIAHWPNGIAGRGELRHGLGHVVDILPTLLDVASAGAPSASGNPPLPGYSLVPEFAHDGALKRDYVFFHHEGNRALRAGDWKLVSSKTDGDGWELYDLSHDRGEQKNLAGEQPERVREMAARWQQLEDQFLRDAGQTPSAGRGKGR